MLLVILNGRRFLCPGCWNEQLQLQLFLQPAFVRFPPLYWPSSLASIQPIPIACILLLGYLELVTMLQSDVSKGYRFGPHVPKSWLGIVLFQKSWSRECLSCGGSGEALKLTSRYWSYVRSLPPNPSNRHRWSCPPWRRKCRPKRPLGSSFCYLSCQPAAPISHTGDRTCNDGGSRNGDVLQKQSPPISVPSSELESIAQHTSYPSHHIIHDQHDVKCPLAYGH